MLMALLAERTDCLVQFRYPEGIRQNGGQNLNGALEILAGDVFFQRRLKFNSGIVSVVLQDDNIIGKMDGLNGALLGIRNKETLVLTVLQVLRIE